MPLTMRSEYNRNNYARGNLTQRSSSRCLMDRKACSTASFNCCIILCSKVIAAKDIRSTDVEENKSELCMCMYGYMCAGA